MMSYSLKMISYSLSFGIRTRCKFCGCGPKYLSLILAANVFPNAIQALKKSIEYQSSKISSRSGIANTNYLFFPNKNTKLTYSSTNKAYSSVNVKMNKEIKFPKANGKFIFNSSFSCECLKTAWVTRDIELFDKNHIKQRLSFKYFPQSIIII